MVEGANQTSRNDYVNNFKTDGANGPTVHLVSSSNENADSDTTISSDSSTSTAPSDWSITHDNAAGTTKLENTSSIDFGSPSGFVVTQIVVESPNNSSEFIIDNSPSGDTDLSGDGSTSIPSGSLSYTFGGE